MIYPKKPPLPYPPKDSRVNQANSRKHTNSQQTYEIPLINEQFIVSKQKPTIHKVTSLYDLRIDYVPDQQSSNDPETILSPMAKSGSKTQRLIESVSVKNPITVLKKHYQQNKALNTSRERHSSPSASRQRRKMHSESDLWKKNQSSKLKVEPFVPVDIPARKKVTSKIKALQQEYFSNQTTSIPQARRQIQIFLEKDKQQISHVTEKREKPKERKEENESMRQQSSSFELLNDYSELASLSAQDKQGLKKLFKKMRRLTNELQNTRQERNKLSMQLQHIRSIHGQCEKGQQQIKRLENENFKLKTQIQVLKKQFQLQKRERSMERVYRHNKKCPGSRGNESDNSNSSSRKKERIKEVIIQKPVYIEKEVLGPERIVEKIVQVPKIIEIPKYIEVEKKVYVQPSRQAPEVITEIKYIQKPVIVQKPVYIDKPIYIDRPVYTDRNTEMTKKEYIAKSPPSRFSMEERQQQQVFSVPVPYPYQVPVYIDKPIVDNSHLEQVQKLESQNISLRERNSQLTKQNIGLRTELIKHSSNLDILKRHNQSKNKEIEHLLRNTKDYSPVSSSSTMTEREIIRKFD